MAELDGERLKSIRGILFDKDGTLLDYYGTWMPANREAALQVAVGDGELAEHLLSESGYDPRSGRVRSGSDLAAGTNREIAETWSRLLAARGIVRPADALQAVLDETFERVGREGAVAVTDLVPFLSGLRRRGLALGVGTNDSEQGARQSLGRFGVVGLFDFLAGYDSGHGTKPGPGPVRAFCRATGLDASEVMVVGDNRHDLEMGRAAEAGLVVGVLTGTSLREDLAGHADCVLASIVELEALIFADNAAR